MVHAEFVLHPSEKNETNGLRIASRVNSYHRECLCSTGVDEQNELVSGTSSVVQSRLRTKSRGNMHRMHQEVGKIVIRFLASDKGEPCDKGRNNLQSFVGRIFSPNHSSKTCPCATQTAPQSSRIGTNIPPSHVHVCNTLRTGSQPSTARSSFRAAAVSRCLCIKPLARARLDFFFPFFPFFIFLSFLFPLPLLPLPPVPSSSSSSSSILIFYHRSASSSLLFSHDSSTTPRHGSRRAATNASSSSSPSS